MNAETTDSSIFFSGEFSHALDVKNRVVIPADWRPGDIDTFLVSPQVDDSCLQGMPMSTFRTIVGNVKASTQYDALKKRNILTYLNSTNQRVKIDAQGRISLPDELVKKMGLKKQVVLVGIDDRFEIWEPEKWKLRVAEVKNDFISATDLLLG